MVLSIGYLLMVAKDGRGLLDLLFVEHQPRAFARTFVIVDGKPFFTMELVEGGSLAQRLAGTPQPAREAAALAPPARRC